MELVLERLLILSIWILFVDEQLSCLMLFFCTSRECVKQCLLKFLGGWKTRNKWGCCWCTVRVQIILSLKNLIRHFWVHIEFWLQVFISWRTYAHFEISLGTLETFVRCFYSGETSGKQQTQMVAFPNTFFSSAPEDGRHDFMWVPNGKTI